MALLNQDLSSYTNQDFDPIPPGEYDFEINDSDVVDTKTGKRMIKVSCKVLGPTHSGRIVFENFVIGQDVAMSRLKTLATVGGHPRPDFIQDTQELHGLRFRGNVGIRESEGYSPQNSIKSFKKIPGTSPAPMPFPTAQPPVAHSLPPAGAPPKMTPPPMQQSLGAAAASSKPSAPWIK